MADIQATFTGFDYLEASDAKEIMRNVLALVATPAGTCAGDRSYGIDQGIVDAPRPVVENQLAIEVAEKIERYEPRVEIVDVEFSSQKDGQLIARFLIGPNEEYMEQLEESEDDGYEDESQDY